MKKMVKNLSQSLRLEKDYNNEKKITNFKLWYGNINSIKNTFQKFDCDVQVGDSVKSINLAEVIILPGVGTFPDSIGLLKEKLIFNYLKKIAKKVNIY